MSTYQKADSAVREMAEKILEQFDTHKPLVEHKVKIDFVFAFASVDNFGNPKGPALTKHGIAAYGITRKMGLKDRAMGRGDAEISLDGDWWAEATEARRRALLDHELHHLEVKLDDDGILVKDELRRPKLKLRKHDVEVGWFAIVAGCHGGASLEIEQAKALMDSYGQLFWPAIDSPYPLTLSERIGTALGMDDGVKTPGKKKKAAKS